MLHDSLPTNATSLKSSVGDRGAVTGRHTGAALRLFAIAVRPEAGLDIFNRYS